MTYVLSVLIALLSIVFLLMCLYANKLKQETEKELKEAENEQKIRNEQKESMETGSGSSDFNASVELLHNLANRK